jgi:Peroxidase
MLVDVCLLFTVWYTHMFCDPQVFYRMGFDDRGIVALSGAHTLGRAYPSRSGFGVDKTKYTVRFITSVLIFLQTHWKINNLT